MNTKAEFTMQGLLLGLVFVALVSGVFAGIVSILGPGYSLTDDVSVLNEYNTFERSNLSADLDRVKNNVDGLSIDSGSFDWFSNIWNKLTAPFRIMWQTYDTANTLGSGAISELQLLPIYQEFIDAAIVILVIIGIVIIKMYLGRKK